MDTISTKYAQPIRCDSSLEYIVIQIQPKPWDIGNAQNSVFQTVSGCVDPHRFHFIPLDAFKASDCCSEMPGVIVP